MNISIKRHNDQLIEWQVTFDDLHVSLLNLGATIYDVAVSGHLGRYESIVLKLKKPTDYVHNQMFLGTTVGSYAGRIAGGTFTYEGKEYVLQKNDGNVNFLHGGNSGLHTKYFDAQIEEATPDKVVIIFSSKLTTNDDGLPGNLFVKVKYTITNFNLRIDYETTSDAIRLCNITNHTYWNLCGVNKQIKAMNFKMNYQYVMKNDGNAIPFEKLKPCSELDFSNGLTFKEMQTLNHEIIQSQGGLDNYFVITPDTPIVLNHNSSKRGVAITSDYPGAVVYTLNGGITDNISYWPVGTKHLGAAIEFQNQPNDVNEGDDRSIIKPNEVKRNYINFTFISRSKAVINSMIAKFANK